jgi:hypothetical protein
VFLLIFLTEFEMVEKTKKKYLFLEKNEGLPVTLTFGHGPNDTKTAMYGMTIELTDDEAKMVPASYIRELKDDGTINMEAMNEAKKELEEKENEDPIKTKEEYDRELAKKVLNEIPYEDLLQLKKDKFNALSEKFVKLKKKNHIINMMLDKEFIEKTLYIVSVMIEDSGAQE